MRSFANWMISILMTLFWFFRLYVSYADYMDKNFLIKPLDPYVEIVLLFVALICIVMFFKRLKLGGILYLVAYGGYFGADVISNGIPLIKGEAVSSSMGIQVAVSAMGVILAVIVMIDLLMDHVKKAEDTDTSWFYNNPDLDKKIDEREDRNRYKYF